MSIIEMRRFHIRGAPSPASEEIPPFAASAYAQALAGARILSFKLPPEPGKPVQRRRGVRHPFKTVQLLVTAWIRKRRRARSTRELETVLRGLDCHTLKDIGFEVMKEKANHPRGAKCYALVEAVKAVSENRLSGLS